MANTSSRTLRLLSLLQTHRYWPGAELAERLGVSVRTLRRGKSSKKFWKLRGDVQSDGTAVLFEVKNPSSFWGYLEPPDMAKNGVVRCAANFPEFSGGGPARGRRGDIEPQMAGR